LFPRFYWIGGYFYSLVGSFVSYFNIEVGYSIKNPHKGVNLLFSSSFFIILFLNFLAIFPFVFSSTSHLLITFPFAYGLWFSTIFFRLTKSFSYFLSHLVPSGTPIGLISFIVLVELLSRLIRPIALMFRLSANMLAGHLLMSLIGGALLSIPFSFTFFGSFFQSLLVFIELAVCFIQSYVFTTLLILYLSESEN